MHAQTPNTLSSVQQAKESITEKITTFYIVKQSPNTSEDGLIESILTSITDRNLNAWEYESLAFELGQESITNDIISKIQKQKNLEGNEKILILRNEISLLVINIKNSIECNLSSERIKHQFNKPPALSFFASTPESKSPRMAEEETHIDFINDVFEQDYDEEEKATIFIQGLFEQADRGNTINYEERIDTFTQPNNGHNDLQKLKALIRAINNENDPIAIRLSEIQTPSSDNDTIDIDDYDFDFTFIENFLDDLRTVCQKMITNHKKRPHDESKLRAHQGALKKQTRYQPQRTTTPPREFNALIRDKLESFREELKIMVEVLSKKLFIPESQINEHRDLNSQFYVWRKKLESFSHCAHMCKKEDFTLNEGAIRIFKNFLKHFFTEDSILSAGNADLQAMSNTMHERQFHSSYNKFLIRDLVSQIRLIKLRYYLTIKGKQNKLESEEVEKFIQDFKLPYEDEMLDSLLTYFPETENSISSMPPFRLGRMNINGQDIDLTDLNDHQAWDINTCQTITQIQENRQQYDWGNSSTEMRSFRNKLESRGLLTAEYPSAVVTETATEDPTSPLGFKPIGRILG